MTESWNRCNCDFVYHPYCTEPMFLLPQGVKNLIQNRFKFGTHSQMLQKPFFSRPPWSQEEPMASKAHKWISKGCPLSPGFGHHIQTWSHLGPKVPKMTPQNFKTLPPSLPREPKRGKKYQKYMGPADCAERLNKCPETILLIRNY